MRAIHLLVLLMVSLCSACVSSHPPDNSRQTNIDHSVLRPGQELSFRNLNGSVIVQWKDDFVRTYVVNGVAYTTRLEGRPEAFEGKSGIYCGALFASKADDRAHPARRLVVEESRIDFESTASMEAYLEESRTYYAWVANRSGYVAGYCENPERNQINVSLYRFYLNGKPALQISERSLSKGMIGTPHQASAR